VIEPRDNLDSRYQRLLHARHPDRKIPVRPRVTPSGAFEATIAIQIETGPYRRWNITAHTRRCPCLLRRLGPARCWD
jgi:hypothetical protein